MVYILPVFVIIVAYFSGRMPEVLFKVNKRNHKPENKGETCLNGMFLLFIIWDLLALGASYLGIGFTVIVRIYVGVLGVILIASNVILYLRRKPKKWYSDITIPNIFIFAVAVFLLQIALIYFIAPDVSEDNIKVSVLTIISDGRLHVTDPGTGISEGYSVNLLGRIPELDSFYAMLAYLSEFKTEDLMYRSVPVIVLMFSYMAYGMWVDLLCDKTEEGKRKKSILYVVIGTLNICGSISTSGIYYYQMHCGFRPEVIIFSVFVPYVTYLCIRIFRDRDHVCIASLVLTYIASLGITSLARGFVPLAAVTVISAVIIIWGDLAVKHGWIRNTKTGAGR
ncbi:MAG: hypothetical protein K6A72_03165 [Lachnospiraceae bacterium]|nr:hypothetical protein [Lachnospiraceae bacterium]